jgi:hypothetical protein
MLVLHGGQFYNPDEYRYLTSRTVAKDIQKGHFVDAFTDATKEADHLGFKIFGILPALIEKRYGEDPRIPAFFFSLFSWLNISIVWLLAKRLGADEKESLWATIFAASSNVLFFYSSHLFPYDIALTFGLLALYIALQERATALTSATTGFLAFLTFFTYNGYWTLAGFAMLAHILPSIKENSQLLTKSIWVAMGFFAPAIGVIVLSWHFGNDLLNSYITFSKTIINGQFTEGWSIPFKYLWASERFMLVIWLCLAIYAATIFAKDRESRITTWLAGLMFIYACFVVSSVLLQKFVVYGRLARQLVPFFALASAYGLRIIQDQKQYGKTITQILVVFIILQAGFNLQEPFQLVYPAEFSNKAKVLYPDFKPPKNMTYFYTPNIIDVGQYKAYFVKYVFPLPENQTTIEGEILMRAENPMSSFLPFRFDEGYTPQERIHFPKIEMIITRVQK